MFLCRQEGKDYLLVYHPTMYQGMCDYGYELFSLENGEKTIIDSAAVSFDINFGAPNHGEFDPAAIAAFVSKVNGYLAKSEALLVTDEDLLSTFAKNGALVDDLWFLDSDDFTRDESKTLEENLRAYAETR